MVYSFEKTRDRVLSALARPLVTGRVIACLLPQLGSDVLFPPGVSNWAAQQELLEYGDGLSQMLAALGQENRLLHDGE
jgi:hypothetical protein